MLALSALVAMEVAAGLGGFYRPGGWIPVSVTLSNDGPELEGLLEVELGPARVSMPVALSAPSRKRLDLVLPAPRSGSPLAVRLRAGGQEVEPSSFDLEPLPPAVPLEIHVLTEDELLFRTTPLASSLPGARIVSMTPEEVPGRWKSLDAAGAVVSSRLAFEALRESQRLALRRWSIGGGGRLLVEDAEFAAPLFDPDSDAPFVEGQEDGPSARRSAGRIAILYLASVAALQIVLALGKARLAMRFWITVMGVLAFAVFLAAAPGLSSRQRSVIHVFPGGGVAYVESRIVLDFGRSQAASIEAASPDVFFAPIDRERGLSYQPDADGRLRASGARFRWERETLRVQGFVEAHFLSDGARLSNHSGAPLRGCSLLGPESTKPLPDVPPRGVLAIGEGSGGDTVVCDSDFIPELLSLPAVQWEGATRVVFHLRKPT
jgi:hypothetical protein